MFFYMIQISFPTLIPLPFFFGLINILLESIPFAIFGNGKYYSRFVSRMDESYFSSEFPVQVRVIHS